MAAIIKFEFPSHSGPVHAMETPSRIGSFARTVDMEKTAHLAEVARRCHPDEQQARASNVKSAVYESGTPTGGSTVQIIMFIGGRLANAAPTTSITVTTQKFAGATIVSSHQALSAVRRRASRRARDVGSLVHMRLVRQRQLRRDPSPTMNATQLANVMRTVRPDLEIVVEELVLRPLDAGPRR